MSKAQSAITGTWYNELGSRMDLTANDDGSLTGKYHSAVGDVPKIYALSGQYNLKSLAGRGVSLSWTVSFEVDTGDTHIHSTSAWSGQFFASPEPVILTQWLLTRSGEREDLWESTHVGHDEFAKVKPSHEQIARAHLKSRALKF
ncbi:hypothetical protein ONZ45_g7600 [Pleurotus djamor]|nr:hypothetical protein ONZ45_g7600 [Pleurotus djamor]